MNLDPNMPVLIVDGYATMVRIMRKLLQQIGYVNIDAALSVEEAIAKIRMNKYALIISDWQMQPVTGRDLLQRIRAEEAAADPTPFLFVTADAMRDSDGTAHHAGVSSYLEKPFSAAILKQKIDGIFGALQSETAIPAADRAGRHGSLQS